MRTKGSFWDKRMRLPLLFSLFWLPVALAASSIDDLAHALEKTAALNQRIVKPLPPLVNLEPTPVRDALRGGHAGVTRLQARIPVPTLFDSDCELPLPVFLEQLFQIVDAPLSLALLYLDRACAMSTPRTTPKCPFVTPRTVHRLTAVAILLAGNSDANPQVAALLQMTVDELQQAIHWMQGALGVAGKQVRSVDLQRIEHKLQNLRAST